jgi:hypothetical protein
MRETKIAYKIVIGKPELKRLVEIPRGGWIHNITVNFERRGGVDGVHLAQDKAQRTIHIVTVMTFRDI